jgi:hypothetical protein
LAASFVNPSQSLSSASLQLHSTTSYVAGGVKHLPDVFRVVPFKHTPVPYSRKSQVQPSSTKVSQSLSLLSQVSEPVVAWYPVGWVVQAPAAVLVAVPQTPSGSPL